MRHLYTLLVGISTLGELLPFHINYYFSTPNIKPIINTQKE